MKKFIFLTIFSFLFVINNSAQKVEVEQTFIDDATKAFVEVVALRKANLDLSAELETNKSLRAKEEAYNAELLKAVSLLVSSEKRDKGFFKKLADQLGKMLKAATKPEHLTTIVTLIVLLKKL